MTGSAVPRLVLAAPGTGQGKTTVAAAILAGLAARGLRSAPFKAGPDYVDSGHLAAAAGRPARNLDAWLLRDDALLALFRRGTTGIHAADVAVVEGMMGMFDGRGAGDEGSTAALARLLRAPVVLVLDVWTTGRSAAATVAGFHRFAADLPLAGVVLNRAAGPGHFALCRDAVEGEAGVPVLGWVPGDAALAVPERHLGLVLAAEGGIDLARLRERTADTLDWDALLAVARAAPPLPPATDPVGSTGDGRPRARVAVARDAAFAFLYEDNLDLLRAAGAELAFFSPLDDARLPDGADALFLCGGYPELHAARLAANAAMRDAVRRFAASGRPVYAECGGLMYLAESLVDPDGVRHPMAGVVPGTSVMGERPVIGYREATALRASPVAEAGWTLRGHEFHHSSLAAAPASPAYRFDDGVLEGVLAGPADNVLASYLHLHFAADPRIAARLVTRAAAARNSGTAGQGTRGEASSPAPFPQPRS